VNENWVLLTGATGHIGQFLLRDLLLRDQPLAVLIRPKPGMSSGERLTEVLEQAERSAGRSLRRPVCLAGDTSHELFGLAESDRHWVTEHCTTLLHNAAAVDFGDGSGATWQNNVLSAERVVQCCAQFDFQHLAYVSTAYVCGRRAGVVREDELARGQTFRNEYEESKYEAEQLVRRDCPCPSLTVLRPGIVIGDYRTGRSHSFHGFYRLAQFAQAMSTGATLDEHGRWALNVRLNLDGHEIRNLVTVDWVSEMIAQILASPELHGRTYHLTPQQPTLSREILDALEAYFHFTGVQFVGRGDLPTKDVTFEEARLYDFFAGYLDYWINDPAFDRTNTDLASRTIAQPRIDTACLMRMVDYAVRNRFGRSHRRRPAKRP
jgi:thioester reductase-like protein